MSFTDEIIIVIQNAMPRGADIRIISSESGSNVAVFWKLIVNLSRQLEPIAHQ